MKLTKKRIVFFIMHLIFTALVPIALVIVRYSTVEDVQAAVGFKVSITGILLLLLVFWVIKKLIIDRRLEELNVQAGVLLADLKIKTEPTEVANIEKALKGIRTAQVVCDAIIPALFIAAAIVAFKALEAQIIKLSATLGYIAISLAIGFIFNILHAREVHSKHTGGK